MASKVNKKITLNIQGIVDVSDGKITIEVEDVETPMDLTDLIQDFNGLETKITLSHGVDIV